MLLEAKQEETLKNWKLPALGLVALVATLAGFAGSTEAATTASAPPRAELAKAAAGYKVYVEGESKKLVATVQKFSAALEAGNLASAKALYSPARSHYEAIEPVAESFGNLDPAIDAHFGDVPASKWSGFHRIEQILWVKNTTAGSVPFAKQLLANVKLLQTKVKTLTFKPVELANGSLDLLNEVATSKITGEEERYSHTDLPDFQANFSGSRKAFTLLTPALEKEGQATLVASINARFDKVQKDLNRFKTSTPLGFVYYGAVTAAERRTFSQDLDALAEPLSTVADKVNG